MTIKALNWRHSLVMIGPKNPGRSIRVDRERIWRLANRDHQELFATELENALQIAAVLPGAGTPYPRTDVEGLRRVYLRKLACHLYYTLMTTK